MSSAQRDHSQPSISVSIHPDSEQPEVHEVELAWQSYPASQSQPASSLDPRAQLALPDRLEVVRQESLVPRARTTQRASSCPGCKREQHSTHARAAEHVRSRACTHRSTGGMQPGGSWSLRTLFAPRENLLSENVLW